MSNETKKLDAKIESAKHHAANGYGTVDYNEKTVKRLDVVIAQLDKLNFLMEKIADLRGDEKA